MTLDDVIESLTTTNVLIGVIGIVSVLEAALAIVLSTGGFMLFRRLFEMVIELDELPCPRILSPPRC